MKARTVLSMIFVILPLVVAAAGIIAAVSVSLSGEWTEGGEWLFLFMFLLPADGLLAVPLDIVALFLNKEARLLFVKITAITELVLFSPFALLGVLFFSQFIKSLFR